MVDLSSCVGALPDLLSCASGIPFYKMHSLGNDFILFIDPPSFVLTPSFFSSFSQRREGVGCDQILVLTSSKNPLEWGLSIWNNDGLPAAACGNGTRCAAWLLLQNKPSGTWLSFNSPSGLLKAYSFQEKIYVMQGYAYWFDQTNETRFIFQQPSFFEHGPLTGFLVTIGNPHLVVFTSSLSIKKWGLFFEKNALFPEGINTSFVCRKKGRFHVQVWERGAGLTPACASGACAIAAVIFSQDLHKGPEVSLFFEKGALTVFFQPHQPFWHQGPVHLVCQGFFPLPVSP